MKPETLAVIHSDLEQIVEAVGEPLRQLEGKALLVTGASGYLASYLVDTVAWLNDHVFAAPCLAYALVRTPVTPDARLGHLIGRQDVQFIVTSVVEPVTFDRRLDYIVHAASKASPRDYLQHPLDTIDANVTATRWLLERARHDQVSSFMYFSSGEIYGEATLVPTPETYRGSVDPTSERACYTESKRFGETLTTTYHRLFGVPAKIVRPFHIYGPGMRLDDGRVMADFLRNRLFGEPIHLLSDGTGSRAFGYISDATVGFWKVLLSDHNGEAFNIGDDREPISMRALAEQIAALYDPILETSFAPSLPEHLRGTPSRVCPNITQARTRLGYAPTVSLQEGIHRTLASYQALE